MGVRITAPAVYRSRLPPVWIRCSCMYEFISVTPSSRAIEVVSSLNVDPGSYTSEISEFLHILFQYIHLSLNPTCFLSFSCSAFAGRCLRVIQIEIRVLCHRKYIACFRIHHDSHGSVRTGLLHHYVSMLSQCSAGSPDPVSSLCCIRLLPDNTALYRMTVCCRRYRYTLSSVPKLR